MPDTSILSSGKTFHSFQHVHLDPANWDDLRFPAHGIAIGSLTAPPDVQTDTGLFLFDGVSTNETIAILAQFPHCKKLGSAVVPHIHWRKTSDAAGDVVWSLRYKWFNNGDLEGDWSSTITGTTVSALDPGSTQSTTITTFGEIDPPSDEALSSMMLVQVGRLPGNASDTYEADALFYEFDFHYQTDIPGGSRSEYVK